MASRNKSFDTIAWEVASIKPNCMNIEYLAILPCVHNNGQRLHSCHAHYDRCRHVLTLSYLPGATLVSIISICSASSVSGWGPVMEGTDRSLSCDLADSPRT